MVSSGYRTQGDFSCPNPVDGGLQLHVPRSNSSPCWACIPKRHTCTWAHTRTERGWPRRPTQARHSAFTSTCTQHSRKHERYRRPDPVPFCMEVPLVAGPKHSVWPGAGPRSPELPVLLAPAPLSPLSSLSHSKCRYFLPYLPASSLEVG